MKDNKEIKLGDNVTVSKSLSSNKYSLSFKKLSATDIGLYKIVATNKCGSASCSSNLNVLGGPVFIKKPNDEVLFTEKKQVKVEFEVTGLPLPDIEW